MLGFWHQTSQVAPKSKKYVVNVGFLTPGNPGGSKIPKIIRKCWVSNTRLLIFAWKNKKLFFTPWLRLEFWGVDSAQDFARIGCAFFLEWFGKVPKIGLWEDSGGLGSTFGPGDLFGIRKWCRKTYFCDDIILWGGDRGFHPAQTNSMVTRTLMGRLLCLKTS